MLGGSIKKNNRKTWNEIIKTIYIYNGDYIRTTENGNVEKIILGQTTTENGSIK